MGDYTIWDGFNDAETPLVDVDAPNLESRVEAVRNAHPFDTEMFDVATEFLESGPHTVMQLARRLGSFTYVTNGDGTYPDEPSSETGR